MTSVLEASFAVEDTPGGAAKAALAARTGLTTAQVGTWFNNARQRRKRAQAEGAVAAARGAAAAKATKTAADASPADDDEEEEEEAEDGCARACSVALRALR